ncbi:uncharacterized protein LOC125488488 isoform X1 [Plutella xylostella]|uniref:uncharacterized protein LOC125488488 isoform X1 n=1 Tax=Plutella xylostella TaxID=51655 RepID=UPI002033050B|nr:uncharacterized protein LOC125488488 isoform X1 [Plutella xylostella]
MNMSERSLHPSPAQLNALIDFLERQPHLAKGIAKTQHAREKNRRQWDDLSLTLNSMGGTYKSPKQWTKYWSDKKSAVKKKAAVRAAARRNTGGGPEVDVIELSEAEERIVVLCGGETFGTGNAHSGIHLFPTPNLSLVMQCCMTLIQSHGSVVERVIDDPAFQKILTLTPLTAEERGRVTSEGVRGMMEEEEEDCGELDTSEVQEQANETEIEVPIPAANIKDETGVIHWQCSCDEISGRHDDACAAAAVDYLQHYRMISAYRATCTICDKTLTWTSVATLRRHLQRQHPEVTVVGDHVSSLNVASFVTTSLYKIIFTLITLKKTYPSTNIN